MTNYLIWSNEHQGWWRQNRHGYTTVIQWAGLFGEHEAFAILDRASQGRQTHVADDLGVYPAQVVPREVLVAVTDEGHPGGPDSPPAPILRALHGSGGADATDDRYTNP